MGVQCAVGGAVLAGVCSGGEAVGWWEGFRSRGGMGCGCRRGLRWGGRSIDHVIGIWLRQDSAGEL